MAVHAIDEANRCLQCKKPMCQQGCPIHTPIPVSYTHLDVYKRQFFLREQDGHWLYYGAISDISQQKQREQQLEASQRALSSAVHISEKDESFMTLTEENRRAAAAIFAQMTPGGMIGGYCEEGFPLYFANHEMVKLLGYETFEELSEACLLYTSRCV